MLERVELIIKGYAESYFRKITVDWTIKWERVGEKRVWTSWSGC